MEEAQRNPILCCVGSLKSPIKVNPGCTQAELHRNGLSLKQKGQSSKTYSY